MGEKLGAKYSEKGVEVMGVALNVTSRQVFFKKLKEHFDYDPKSGHQEICVPESTRGLENAFNLRGGGFPAFYVVDIRDGWKVIHHRAALNTGSTNETCEIPVREVDHSDYINRMTADLSIVLERALAPDEEDEATEAVTET